MPFSALIIAKASEFLKLTSLLHWKADSAAITQGELDAIFNSVFGGAGASADGNRKMEDIFMNSAEECLQAGDGVNFENKIVLSIAIRIAAEKFMIQKINNPRLVADVCTNQTFKLFKKYRELFGGDLQGIKTLQRVILMTPESIHLNSFMYEPILDMSDAHLKRLLTEVQSLK